MKAKIFMMDKTLKSWRNNGSECYINAYHDGRALSYGSVMPDRLKCIVLAGQVKDAKCIYRIRIKWRK